MNRVRLVALVTSLGALITCAPVRAQLAPEPVTEEVPVTERSAPALALLQHAAAVAQADAWAATERVVTVVGGAPVVRVAPVQHAPGQHTAVDAFDPRLFALLERHYALALGGTGICEGRRARVVEARRPGGGLAARFWVDAAKGLLLRREVLDERGVLLRSNELVDVRVGTAAAPPAMTLAAAPQGERLDEPALRGLEADGWPVLRTLPADLELYDARWLLDRVLQLSYSDGLSTLSLFLQRGETPPLRGGTVRQVAGGQVWEASGEPERVVWAARGLTWTLISDTAPSVVDQVLSVLPHTRQRVTQEGLVPRLWRGLDRVGAWLNPFR